MGEAHSFSGIVKSTQSSFETPEFVQLRMEKKFVKILSDVIQN